MRADQAGENGLPAEAKVQDLMQALLDSVEQAKADRRAKRAAADEAAAPCPTCEGGKYVCAHGSAAECEAGYPHGSQLCAACDGTGHRTEGSDG